MTRQSFGPKIRDDTYGCLAYIVLCSEKGFFQGARHEYLSSYKGLAFFTKSPTELMLPGSAELIRAGKIWIPG